MGVQAGRAGGPGGPDGAAVRARLLRNLPGSRKRRFGIGYQDVTSLPLEVVRAYLEPLAGTKERAREFQRWVASLHNRDLAAVEPALRQLTVPTLMVWGTADIFFRLRHAEQLRDMIPGATGVVTVDGGRLFFPGRTRRRPGHSLARPLGRAPRQRRPGLGHPLAR